VYDDVAIRTESLTRRFGELVAVDRLNLTVPRGVIFGFLGPNGAGKSTTINMLISLLPPNDGTATVAGYDIREEPLEVKRRIGVVPEDFGLYERLTASEHLQLTGRLHGLAPAEIEARIPSLLGMLELDEAENKMLLDYSHGMRKKTAIACALTRCSWTIRTACVRRRPSRARCSTRQRYCSWTNHSRASTRSLRGPSRRCCAIWSTGEGRPSSSPPTSWSLPSDSVTRSGLSTRASSQASAVGIINKGQLAGVGSIAELRQRAGLPEDAALEDVFLRTVGAEAEDDALLGWLTDRVA